MAAIEIEKATKSYGAFRAVDGIDLSVGDGEFLVLLGPSGCGKSTLLRMVAGLEDIDGGEIRFAGKRVNEVPTQQRNVAMVFQNYALYPHMSVADNLSFGLKIRNAPANRIAGQVGEAARILGISQLLERKPRQLSGGQRQRVAMGRSIVREPVAFLFDEPLSNLDAKLRGQMRQEIKLLQRRIGTTALYVTHDQVEAMTLADRVVVLNRGRIEQIATPVELYERPASLFVADFVGTYAMSLLDGSAREGTLLIGEHRFPLALPRQAAGKVKIGLRPEHVRPDPEGFLEVAVDIVEPLGSDTIVYGTFAGQAIALRVDPATSITAGHRIRASIAPQKIHVFESESGRRIA